MVKVRWDNKTLDLLGWEPPKIVQRFDEVDVRSSSLRGGISKAVATCLRECEMDRERIAHEMSQYLGEAVSVGTLNAYASEADESHTIPFIRLIALVKITGDIRPLQLGADEFGSIVVDDDYLVWVEMGQTNAKMKELEDQMATLKRRAKKGR